MVKSFNPLTLLETVQIKKQNPMATIYAGGTDLMVAKRPVSIYLFVNQVAELQSIIDSKDTIEIGAAVTYRDLLASDAIPEILKKAIRQIAAPTIRNAATMGGNICNASPAGDTLPILYLLDAVLVLAKEENGSIVRREVPIEEFIQGIRKITLGETEILEKIIIQKANYKWNIKFDFYKVGARKAQAISKVLFCAAIEMDKGVIKDFRVAYGSVGITVVRKKEIENQYLNIKLAQFKKAIPAIIEEYAKILKPIDDQRSTAAYRKKVCLNLLEEFLRMQYSRILIKNGRIADGTGAKAYLSDILIESDRITKIEPCGSFEDAIYEDAQVIDAAGLVVSPGFIDTHSHSDLQVLIEPELYPKLNQGITTEVLGQDGISMAPLPLPYISAWKKNLAGLDGESSQISWKYENTKNYLAMVEEARPAVNECYLLPHGNVRMEAMGLENRLPSIEELQRMRKIVRREMEAGALGLSSGLIYMPCAYSETEELIELCKVVAEYDGIFVVHQRSEADTIIPSMKEIIEIGRKSGVKIHFSHFKVCGKKNWKYLPEMFSLLDQAEKEGITISFDQYPYVAGSTMLGVILPPWAHDGGTDRLMERLKDSTARENMKRDIANGISGWDNFVEFAGLEEIYITSVQTKKNQDIVGLSLKELGEKRQKDALDATFDLLLEEENAVGMVDFYGLEEHVIQIMKRKEMNACTDGLLAGTPHPRVFGAFPRILGKYVREQKVLGMEEAISKMTGKAASAMGIKERGIIQEGNFADIVLWNPELVRDKGTFQKPDQRPEGIRYVIVNGAIAIQNGAYTGNRNGKVIRGRL